MERGRKWSYDIASVLRDSVGGWGFFNFLGEMKARRSKGSRTRRVVSSACLQFSLGQAGLRIVYGRRPERCRRARSASKFMGIPVTVPRRDDCAENPMAHHHAGCWRKAAMRGVTARSVHRGRIPSAFPPAQVGERMNNNQIRVQAKSVCDFSTW